MTDKQIDQFNYMVETLKIITKYDKPDKIRKNAQKDYGLDYEEALEMAYENIQGEAAFSIRNIRPIKKKIKG